MSREQLSALLGQIDGANAARTIRTYLEGNQPSAYLSAESRRSIAGSLSKLAVNFPSVIVQAHADRLRVTGLQRAGDRSPDSKLWGHWQASGAVNASEAAIYDRLAYGRSFLSVWSDEDGYPVVTPDSPLTMSAAVDPASGAVRRAARRWSDGEDTHALLYGPESVEHWSHKGHAPAGSSAWTHRSTEPHRFRRTPVVAFVRRHSADDWSGVSAVRDVLGLTDAYGKLMADMLVTSEYYARPRRWATGLEIMEDDEGNPVDPFGDDRFLQSEAPETKFGQLPAASLESYTQPLRTIVEQIGSTSGLPPAYLGLHGQQTANAEGTRAAETQLTSRAYTEQRGMNKGLGVVARLVEAQATGRPVSGLDVRPVWESPEIRTPGMAADSAQKLASIGVPLESLLSQVMKWEPEDVDDAVAGQRRAAVESIAGNLMGGASS